LSLLGLGALSGSGRSADQNPKVRGREPLPVAKDGQRATPAQISVVLNRFEELKRRVPAETK